MPRVAYFPDSFHEVNGVAHTSRNFAAYAERHGLPFLCVRAGSAHTGAGSRGPGDAHPRPSAEPDSVRMEKDLQFDPLFWRHGEEISRELYDFQPDVIHITGPSELGMFGAYFAWRHGGASGGDAGTRTCMSMRRGGWHG